MLPSPSKEASTSLKYKTSLSSTNKHTNNVHHFIYKKFNYLG